MQRQLHGLVDVFLGTDADRATGTGDQLDIGGQDSAQTGRGNRTLMATTDVHDAHFLRQVECTDVRQPLACRQ